MSAYDVETWLGLALVWGGLTSAPFLLAAVCRDRKDGKR
nr:MAG TPA_asm: hypothetical protein [Caudoviricetes sp.]